MHLHVSGLPDAGEPEAVSFACPRCGTSYTGNFCPSCGWQKGVPVTVPASALRTILGVVWLVAIILFAVYLAAMLGALVWVSPGIVEGIVGGTCSACTAFFFWINPLSPTLLEFVEVGGIGFLAWFLILLTAILGIYLYLLLFHARQTYHDMRLPHERLENKLGSRSAVVAVGQIFMALLFFDLFYFSVILPFGFGFVPEAPPFFSEAPGWFVLYSTVNAAVWEEFATRLLLIGLPMALASFIMRLPQVLSGTVAHNPGRARFLAGSLKYLVGGQVRADSPRAALFVGAGLVLASAAVFGYLHVPAWGAWKFVDTFLAGLALGYLFLRFGILVSMLLHLSVNSLGILFGLAGTDNLGGGFLIGIFYLALVAFGAGFFAYYVMRTGGFLFGRFRRSKPKPVPVPPPGQVPDNPGGGVLLFPVTCPQCGSHEAQYQEGALVCSQCGTRLSTPGPDRGRGQFLD